MTLVSDCAARPNYRRAALLLLAAG